MNLPSVFHYISEEMQFMKRLQTSNGGVLFGRSNIVISSKNTPYFTYSAHQKSTTIENMSIREKRQLKQQWRSTHTARAFKTFFQSPKIFVFSSNVLNHLIYTFEPTKHTRIIINKPTTDDKQHMVLTKLKMDEIITNVLWGFFELTTI